MTTMDIDVAQARRLADLINTSVSQLEDISSSAEKGKGEGRHVQTIVSAATQLAALVRPPAQVLLELATGFTLSAALRLVAEANVPEIIREITDSLSCTDDSGVDLLEKSGGGLTNVAGVPVGEISRLCGVEVGKLERILRLLATHHIFVECPPICADNDAGGEARFANNRLSSALDSGAALEDILPSTGETERESESKQQRWSVKYGAEPPGAGLAALVGILTDESMFHMTALTDVLLEPEPQPQPQPQPSPADPALTNLVEHNTTVETSNRNKVPEQEPDSPYLAPFSIARSLPHSTMFEWLGQPENAHRLHRFGCAMKGMNALESEGAILKGFDFSSLPSGSTIIDVGGGVGAASLPILRANEHLRLVVQDTEEVVNVAPGFWEKHYPEALRSGRVKFEVQDFFEEQPHPGNYFHESEETPKRAYIYLLRMIAHNWGDTHCLRILKRLGDAVKLTSDTNKGQGNMIKLVLVDSVLMPACRSRDHLQHVDRSIGIGEDHASPNKRMKRANDFDDVKIRIREAPEPLLPNWGAANSLAYKLDLIMLANHNALERTLPHFQSLLSLAGWEVVDVHMQGQGRSEGSEEGGGRSGAGESWMPQIVAIPV